MTRVQKNGWTIKVAFVEKFRYAHVRLDFQYFSRAVQKLYFVCDVCYTLCAL